MSLRLQAPIWTTYDGREIHVKMLDNQHLSNIYWYQKVFHNDRVWSEIQKEVDLRFNGKPLLWRPLPVPTEISTLRNLDMIRGNDIIFWGKKIGTIAHLKKKL